MSGSKLLFLASWVILLVASAAILLYSVMAAAVAYRGARDNLTQSLTMEQMRETGGEEAVRAFRGRRVTAAAWAIAYSLLSMFVVLFPYRRAERWAWWAILCSVGLSQLLSIARAPLMGTTGGAGVSGIVLSLFLLGLMAGAHRILFSNRDLI